MEPYATTGPAARSDPGRETGPVAEIVTFRLRPGIDEADFRAAARATGPAAAALPGFLRRCLSRDAQGLWTDHVEWADLGRAEAAAAAVKALPVFAPFGAMIDPEGLSMRHAAVIMTQTY
jgi:hypothetical protein